MLNQFRVILLVLLSALLNTSHAASEHYFQVVFDTTYASESGFESGFGYAVYVHVDGKSILFDTGVDGTVLLRNLQLANIDINGLDATVISHEHNDHIGGLSSIQRVHPDIKIYAPPNQNIGSGNIEQITDQVRLSKNLFVLRTHTEKPTVGIGDELSLLITTREGPYLITACSHTGVATIVDKAEAIAGDSIFYYTGGARLKFRGNKDTRAVANALKARNVKHVSPGHCSIDHAVAKTIKTQFPLGYVASQLGRKIPLSLPDS